MRTLELESITKRFGTVLANDAISLRVERGEVLGIVGENGAGKSTLMSILFGVHGPDSGRIRIDGEPVVLDSPSAAIAHGLGMVFQHFQLFPGMSVVENVVYGAEPGRFGLLRRRDATGEVARLSAEYGLDVPADASIDDLPVGVLQRIEILKALYRGAELLILDEPTGVLTPQEARALLRVLRTLAEQGRAVILISHKLDEIIESTDRVLVLRDGAEVFTASTAETSAAELAGYMTGRTIDLHPRRAAHPSGDAVLRVEHVSTAERDRGALHDVSLTVRAGEIVGIAAVAGNGQETLAGVVAGHRALERGSVTLADVDITGLDNADRRAHGLAHIPEDRHRDGVAGDGDIVTSLVAGFHRRAPISVRGILRPRAMRAHAEGLIRRFGIKVADPARAVRTLSGGNIQKLVVARELAHAAPLLLAEQPTRGVDLGAIEFIYDRLDEYRDGGGAVLLISSELSELLTLSDRIVVLCRGSVVAELPVAEADAERLGLLMSGAVAELERVGG
ncbi:ABC transporter ATP-binding protein [Nocardia callitridis]|uniref:ABC transporter ATP-binding protein n=1 Tax=Nocardia callitridis TaxID=648753 RepID=A0ABP9L5S2_9NOCA